MKFRNFFFLCAFAASFLFSCNKDDDSVEEIPIRDRGEQAIADDEAITAFLQTHFYNYEEFQNPPAGFDYKVRFDTIDAQNAGKTPIIDSDLLMTKTVVRDEVEYNLYILKVREGEGKKPTFADSTFQNYKGELLNLQVFDNTATPIWFDLQGYVLRASSGQLSRQAGVIAGFSEGIQEFGEATGFVVNPDNTITWNNDYGIGAIFVPSGLGYFSSPPAGSRITPYSPLIFTVNLYRTVRADHDGDGIPSYMEDLDGDGNLFNDDTDGDGLPNHSDTDDDGDGTPTRQEIIIRPDGTIEFPDTNGNGTPNYLDRNSFEVIEG